MTSSGRPIYEPNPATLAAGQRYDIERLKRRLAPTGGGFLGEEEFTTPCPTASIAGGGDHSLSWDGSHGGDSVDLLDMSDPTAPSILADGVYAVTVTVIGESLTVGKFFNFELSGGYASVTVSSGIAAATPTHTYASAAFTAFIYGRVDLSAYVYNYDTVARDFYIARAIVLRLL